MDNYQKYIHKSRYARYIDEKGRRENWAETVERFIDNMIVPKISQSEYALVAALERAIKNMDIMPSMRGMMTAGEAARRDNTCIYNCSYLPCDSIRSFDEAMFILLCGTGVGFSVESKYVSNLPSVPQSLQQTTKTIVVPDSKEGWADCFRQLLQELWNGEVPYIDYSQIRPEGARLKTFGGRASGPGPLRELYEFAINLLISAQGRQLTTLECHDLMCKIGEVVVVGGVRRSAMISLSDLHDELIRDCKKGNWWETHPHRALANNSAVYEKRPDVGTFMQEWSSLYDSHSGERGIFNREASTIQAAKSGRRKPNYEWGTNPCSEIILRPYQFCNLTEVICRSTDDFFMLEEKVRLATILGCFQATYTDFPYLRDIWRTNTEEERLLGVSLTGVYDADLLNKIGITGLEHLKQISIETAHTWAQYLGIPAPAATTCIKPSGTVSQLTDSASGCHPRHSPYYIRRVRGDNKDPMTQFLISKGIPNEADIYKPDSTTVFSYPIKAPEGTITRHDLDSFSHMADWLDYQRHWCEHKPSVTINIKENDWPAMGALVWKYFDEITGVSFLPHDGGTYQQAPYEEIDQYTYHSLSQKMPDINFDEFVEQTDTTEGSQQLACVAGICEI